MVTKAPALFWPPVLGPEVKLEWKMVGDEVCPSAIEVAKRERISTRIIFFTSSNFLSRYNASELQSPINRNEKFVDKPVLKSKEADPYLQAHFHCPAQRRRSSEDFACEPVLTGA